MISNDARPSANYDVNNVTRVHAACLVTPFTPSTPCGPFLTLKFSVEQDCVVQPPSLLPIFALYTIYSLSLHHPLEIESACTSGPSSTPAFSLSNPPSLSFPLRAFPRCNFVFAPVTARLYSVVARGKSDFLFFPVPFSLSPLFFFFCAIFLPLSHPGLRAYRGGGERLDFSFGSRSLEIELIFFSPPLSRLFFLRAFSRRFSASCFFPSRYLKVVYIQGAVPPDCRGPNGRRQSFIDRNSAIFLENVSPEIPPLHYASLNNRAFIFQEKFFSFFLSLSLVIPQELFQSIS